jgi:plasmid stabilization system protein ParE
MTYLIEISSIAEGEADNAFLLLSQKTSPEKAREWYEGLLKAIESLSAMPKRCPVARENQYFSK